MKKIIRQAYRVLDNHRAYVLNVGDIFDNDNLTTKSVWGKKRLPLGAYFIKIFDRRRFNIRLFKRLICFFGLDRI